MGLRDIIRDMPDDDKFGLVAKGLIAMYFVAVTVGIIGKKAYDDWADMKEARALEQRIIAEGNVQRIQMLNNGVEADEVVKIIPQVVDGQVKGAAVGVNLSAGLNGLTGYFKTFAEAPISSGVSLLADAGMGYLLYLAGDSVFNGDNNKDGSDNGVTISNSGEGNVFNVVNGNGNSDVNKPNTQNGDNNAQQ